MRVIVFTDDWGGVEGVRYGRPDLPSKQYEGMTEDEACDALAQQVFAERGMPTNHPYRITDFENIPTDRYFREQWDDSNPGETIGVDMVKARVFHMDQIRKARDEKLEELDIEQLQGNDVAAEKQVLRDLPTTFDLTGAATPEDLKALWPAELL
jgi:hypothetical protein